jgi:tetratricopeptide (TPR) repeat protein
VTTSYRRASAILVVILGLCPVPQYLFAQGPSAEANLAAGISQARAGDFFRAVLTLNEAVGQLSTRQGASATLARVHAYRVMAYVGLDQPERARAAVLLALKADPSIVVGANEFSPAVVALFTDARRPAASDPEAAGQAAEQAGRFQEAFLAYLKAFQSLPEPPTRADDQRLRERIITVVRKIQTRPVVPQEARAHLTRAEGLVAADAVLGGSGGPAVQKAAAAELRQAVRIAPWWPDATFSLATVLQKLQQFDEALLNLNLYRLADPEAYAATVARATPRSVTEQPLAPPVVPKPVVPAVIYVYWPEQARGGGRQKVLCNERQVADLQNNRFVVLKAAAGTHNLTFRDRDVTAVVEAGREYHFRASIEGHTVFSLGPEIRLMSADVARAEMREQEMTPNDARRTFSTDCVATPAVRSRAR